mgnify:CR=1 FL=1
MGPYHAHQGSGALDNPSSLTLQAHSACFPSAPPKQPQINFASLSESATLGASFGRYRRTGLSRFSTEPFCHRASACLSRHPAGVKCLAPEDNGGASIASDLGSTTEGHSGGHLAAARFDAATRDHCSRPRPGLMNAAPLGPVSRSSAVSPAFASASVSELIHLSWLNFASRACPSRPNYCENHLPCNTTRLCHNEPVL